MTTLTKNIELEKRRKMRKKLSLLGTSRKHIQNWIFYCKN